MKLIINQNKAFPELEIQINCPSIDMRIKNLIDYIRQYSGALAGAIDGSSVSVPLNTILYIESVDRRTFFYDARRAFRSGESLSALETKLDNSLFERISKNCIVNLAYITATSPAENHRLEIMLKNGERLIAGRRYVNRLLAKLRAYNMTLEESDIEREEMFVGEVLCSIRNDNRILHFHEIPRRVVAVSYTCAELLCALGLEDRLVGVASAKEAIASLLPEYREKLKSIPVIHSSEANTGAPISIREEIDALEPDFICGYYHYKQYLDEYGNAKLQAPFYIMEGSIPGKTTLDSVCRDILNLGKIFHVEETAFSLAEQMRSRARRLPVRPLKGVFPRVFIYDSGKKHPITAFSGTLENTLVSLAGGVNVFGDRPGTYQQVSWSDVAEHGPDCIIVHNYFDYMSAEEKIRWLKTVPELQECRAVKTDRFLILTLSEVFPGIQNISAAEKMCAAFDPDTL